MPVVLSISASALVNCCPACLRSPSCLLYCLSTLPARLVSDQTRAPYTPLNNFFLLISNTLFTRSSPYTLANLCLSEMVYTSSLCVTLYFIVIYVKFVVCWVIIEIKVFWGCPSSVSYVPLSNL